MPFPSGSCLSGLFQAQFVHLEDNVYSLYDFGKAGVGLGVVLVASSVQNGVVAGIDVEFGSLAGKAQCVLFVGVLGRVFQKGQTTGTDGIKVVVTGIARLVHDGRGRNDVINAVVVPKDGPVPQAQRYLIQKSLDGVGHQRQWSHLHHKRTAFQRTRKLHREPNPMRTRTVPLQSNDESERERGKFLVSVVWRWCVCAHLGNRKRNDFFSYFRITFRRLSSCKWLLMLPALVVTTGPRFVNSTSVNTDEVGVDSFLVVPDGVVGC